MLNEKITLPPDLFINRELSLLEFQRRVLDEALDEANPLLERLKFLAIFGSNMDEFFMVRVSGIRKQVEAHIMEVFPDGLTPPEVLAAARKVSHDLYGTALNFFKKKLLRKLDNVGVHLLDYDKLSPAQLNKANDYFNQVVYPVLTPLALDPGHPFPHISNLSLNLAIVVRDKKGHERFARLKVPDTLPRLVPIKRSSGGSRKDGTVPHHHYFVWLEQLITANLASLFPGLEVVAAYPFRIIRDADVEIQEIEADDLLETMQQSIRRRKFGSVVQVEIHDDMPDHVRELLIENLEIRPNDVYILPAPLGLSSLWQIYNNVERHDLKFPVYHPAVPKVFRNATMAGDIFEAIREGNILLHQPYDSFNPVIDFLKAAARDPDVLAIKATLYRVGQNAPVVEALLEASEMGKQVAVLVELKARFDEANNISWARTLEDYGIHVAYGSAALKIHAKIALVVRREPDGVRRYVHLGSGNYNSRTARLYTDVGLLTCSPSIGADVSDLFNSLTGYARQRIYRKLIVAPEFLRPRFIELIQREAEHARAGKRAHIVAKMNALVDPAVIDALYAASQAGVKIDLLVRGICCLRPQVKGMSESIRVLSIVGRFLEHSRVYYFANDGAPEFYIGSADWMPRNFDRRVEVVVPVEKPALHERISALLAMYLSDNRQAWELRSDGRWLQRSPSGVARPSHDLLLANSWGIVEGAVGAGLWADA